MSKVFERSVYWDRYKRKIENKNMSNEYSYFHESNFVGGNSFSLLIYLNRDNDVKQFKAQRYYLPKDIIKNYNIIIIEHHHHQWK